MRSGTILRKVSPLYNWMWTDVWSYVEGNGIPHLPLYDEGYTSIGCAPCTQKPIDPNNLRSGRWSGQKLECGIHLPIRAAEKKSVADADRSQ